MDVLDQKARLYTTKVPCRRWPLQVFYNILDIVAINAVTLYNALLNKNMSSKDFILQMVEDMTKMPTDGIGEEEPIHVIPASGSK